MFEKEAMYRQEKDPMEERLESAGQQAMRSVVKALPEDTLSMAWRSGLNERLVAESAKRQRRQRVAWFLRPALGLGLAGALAVAFLVRSPAPRTVGRHTVATVSASSGSLEAALVRSHRQTTLAMDVAGVGVSPVELSYVSDSDGSGGSVQTLGTSWSETDLDSL